MLAHCPSSYDLTRTHVHWFIVDRTVIHAFSANFLREFYTDGDRPKDENKEGKIWRDEHLEYQIEVIDYTE